MRSVLVFLFFSAALCVSARADEQIRFNRDIRPILSENCFRCHGPDSAARQGDLRLDDRAAAVAHGAIKPGDAKASTLVDRIFSHADEERMPPPETKKKLTDAQKELLKKWVEQGAEYEPHWAWIAPAKEIVPPKVDDPSNWSRGAIDQFVLSAMKPHGLAPAAEATKEAWLRRVSLDLTGLPPTSEEIAAFRADDSASAYEKQVDRLFKSPAYGERMALDWLDAARYADTFGYQADRDMHVWPWRDWAIRAFQNNLPYNEFILHQIAGDMLPGATRDQKLATAFNRLHRQTNEGGSIEEEFRAEYISDRIRTMGSAFLGLTLECCRCHDHKFDPISQKEYYSLSAFFNQIDEHGLYSHFTETAPTPALLLYEADQEQNHKEVLEKIKAAEQTLASISLPVSAPSESPRETSAPAKSFNFEDAKPAGDYKLIDGKVGKAIEFGGDDQFSCGNVADFGRTTPFTFAMWLKPPAPKPRMIVLHRSVAAEDSSFRGYSLVLDNNAPVFSLVHFWPGNAIQVRGKQTLKENEWTHIAITYDGLSRAAGLEIYLNGEPCELEVARDRLTRDIQHRGEWGDSSVGVVNLALGARFRDVGFSGGAVDELEIFDRALTSAEVAKTYFADRPISETALADHTLRHSEAWKTAYGAVLALRKEENDLVTRVKQIMVMQAAPFERSTHLLKRGAYDAPGELVSAEVPSRIFPFPEGLKRDRLGFAKWVVDPQNPLTARVAVNRTWQMLFGRGIVASSEDLGLQGQLPSHPELLDYLARDFVSHNWDLQRLIKSIVLSATYRQASTPRDAGFYAKDPENVWLARGPKYRLQAEMLRDQALAASGLLKPRVGGPSVFPYQPAGLWEEAGTGKSYHPSSGDDLYRRSLYTFWRRTSPPPTMTTLDAPSREYCLVRRERTSSPLQALVLLNDPQFVEAARALAQRELLTHQEDAGAGIGSAFERLASRKPSEREAQVLQALFEHQFAHYQAHVEDAKALLAIGESKRDESVDPARLAAMTVVVQAIMNLDDVVAK
jgi:hypothetical protein